MITAETYHGKRVVNSVITPQVCNDMINTYESMGADIVYDTHGKEVWVFVTHGPVDVATLVIGR
jgi:hypothetical protein